MAYRLSWPVVFLAAGTLLLVSPAAQASRSKESTMDMLLVLLVLAAVIPGLTEAADRATHVLKSHEILDAHAG